MTFLWGRKEKEIRDLIHNYMQEVSRGLEILQECFEGHLKCLINDEKEITNPVHESESRADDLRREINLKLYSGSLMPESRKDLYTLIEAVDKIPNKAETIIENIVLENLIIPEDLKGDFLDLLKKSIETARSLKEGVNALFDDFTRTFELTSKVDKLESRTDHACRLLIKKIFSSRMELAEKIHLKNLAVEISDMADRAENAANILEIIAVKRKV